MITTDIASCETLQDLQLIFDEWHSSFDYIHTAAALVKYARLAKRAKIPALFKRLINLWLQLMPDADTRACSNSLWAFASVGFADQQVWNRTWAEYVQHINHDLGSGADVPVVAQEISSVLWACGKLRRQPAPEEFQLLLQAFLLPAVLDSASPQALSNVALALMQLRQLDSWNVEISTEQLSTLFGDQQLAALGDRGTPQAVSNVLLALARLATGSQPVLTLERAQQHAKELLPAAIRGTQKAWKPQDISTTLYAYGELRLHKTDSQLDRFLSAVVSTAPQWCATSNNINIQQVAYACVQLGYRNEGLMQQMLQRSLQLLGHPHSGRSLSAAHAHSLGALCIWSVTQLGMPKLVPTALEVVARSGIGKHTESHPQNLRRLWESHTWLLQHHLGGGKGLAGLVRHHLLLQGQQKAAERANMQFES